MDLLEHIDRAEKLTAALGAALAAGDDPACLELLAARGDALAALAGATAADPAGSSRLQTRLHSLVDADRRLQTEAQSALAAAGAAFDLSIATGNRPHPGRDAETLPSAVDRHA